MSEYPVVVLGLVNVFGGLLFGYNTGNMGPSLGPMCASFNVCNDNLKLSLYTASILLGAMIGSLVGGMLCDYFGRKMTMMIASLLTITGAIVSAMSFVYYILIGIRVVLGFGVGLTGVVCPIYVAENAPSQKKGILGALFQLAVTVGIVLAFIVGLVTIYSTSGSGVDVPVAVEDFQWRFMIGTGIIPAFLLMFLAIVVISESKIWIDNNEDINSGISRQKGFFNLFKKKNIRSTLLGVVLAITLQLTGVNIIMYYGVQLLKEALQINNDPILVLVLNVIIGTWNAIATLVALFFVERVGRRPLMLFGVVCLTISLIFSTIVFKFFLGAQKNVLIVLILVGLGLFLLGFESGPGGLFWTLITEITREEVKDQAASFINFLQWGFNLLVTSTFLILTNSIGLANTFLIYTIVSVIVTIYLFIELRETKKNEDQV